MVIETGARSSTLREPDVAALRQRLMVARHLVAHAEASGTGDCRELLLRSRESYARDIDALLAERRELLETIAALRRVAVAAEAALAESRAKRQPERVATLVSALAVAGYTPRPTEVVPLTGQ
jgi:hypothetical protein